MAQAASRSSFEERAHSDPYAFMETEDMEFIANEFEIIPMDAADPDNDLSADMSWGEQHIGSGGLKSVTDYGRHRNNCDTLADFEEFIREELQDGMPSQYTKVMDDDKERVAEKLIAVTRKNGYIVVPYFED